MRHSAIAATAIAAATVAANHVTEDGVDDFAEREEMEGLYSYARERKFPEPETLARKAGELIGHRFPFTSIAEAPEGLRVFFTTFRAVAQALDPFHEDDPAEVPAEPQEKKPMDIAEQKPPAPARADDVASRTEAGQQAMDQAIAESGGQFSPPAEDAAEDKAKKKTR